MSKRFSYIKGATLQDVMAIALDEDEGSRTAAYRYLEDCQRLWLLRELINDPRLRYIECFDFNTNGHQDWGMRGWAEEENIPYTDCPLDLLALTSGPIRKRWRMKVLSEQGRSYRLPPGSWLHSVAGVGLSDGRRCHDFQFLESTTFACPMGERWHLEPDTVARIVQEGFGVASSRC